MAKWVLCTKTKKNTKTSHIKFPKIKHKTYFAEAGKIQNCPQVMYIFVLYKWAFPSEHCKKGLSSVISLLYNNAG